MNYPLHLGIYLALYLIAAFAMNIVSGYCGLLTLAHSAYFAIGAYVYALLALRLGWGVLIILPIAILFACITSPSFVTAIMAIQGRLFCSDLDHRPSCRLWNPLQLVRGWGTDRHLAQPDERTLRHTGYSQTRTIWYQIRYSI